jgi:hypothetical protein
MDCASEIFLSFLFLPIVEANIKVSPTAMWENVFLLIVTALLKIALTAWTFGMMVNYPVG